MARARSRIPLNMFLNGRLVGRLLKEPSGAIEFRYDDSWLRWKHAFAVSLSLPLREDRYVGDAVSTVFDNLLPDNSEIRRRLAQRVSADGEDAYSLLGAIGRDCVGALQFLPEGEKAGAAGHVSGERLSEQRIASLIADLARAPLGVSTDDAGLRISLAGAQEKTALLLWKGRWHLPRGSTATTHILKPAIGVLGNGLNLSRSVENEHFCMQLAAALGLPAAKTRVHTVGGSKVLAVERFDRHWTQDGRLLRLPQEDCCQALSVPPALKYQSDGGPGVQDILQLLKASDEPATDRRLFMRAQIVFWLLAATDGHAKNFSLFLHPGGGFRLTPLYDVMSLQPNHDAGQVKRNRMKLAMSVGTKRHCVIDTVRPYHFIQSAEGAGMPASEIEGILADLASRGRDAARSVAEQLAGDVPRPMKKSILDGFARRLALVEAHGD